MSKVFIFDVDGTLTPSRLPMTNEFELFFNGWSKSNPFYLVTGSNLNKTKEQVPNFIFERAESVFTCCGNQMWKNDDLIYENKFEIPKHLEMFLNIILKQSPYPHRYGNHIEDRGSMVNFSIVGRDCTQEQRDDFFEWDNINEERKKITNIIRTKAKGIDAVIGGQISIDIYPTGNDKSQILEHIEADEYVFIGDRTEEGGNDYPLAKLMEVTDNCSYYQTEGWKQTKEILEKLSD